uniref:Uncharacterized protein n=1 Tax=Manihot esculenta TaxID=3983 RepID=A0A2C9VBB9_MANES
MLHRLETMMKNNGRKINQKAVFIGYSGSSPNQS